VYIHIDCLSLFFPLFFSFSVAYLSGDASAWQQCVREAIEATVRGFGPESPEVVCHIDKRAFKGPDRDALVAFIEQELGVRTAMKPSDLYPPTKK